MATKVILPFIFGSLLAFALPALALVDVNVNLDTNFGAQVDPGEAEDGATSSGEVISITRDELDSTGIAEVISAEVESTEDLKAYAKSAIQNNESLEALNFSRDTVEVKYIQDGKLLAIVSVKFTVTARAFANGKVEIDYPWYSFLTVDNSSKVKTDLAIAVETVLNERMVGKVRAEGEVAMPYFTANESAMIASEMERLLAENEGLGLQ